MKVLSLFDGISCGRVALERAGIKVDKYYASEIDKYAQQVSDKNYPGIIRMGDVTKWRAWDIDWRSIDLVLAGSPCQGFSFAGKQLAFDDPRSALFFEFVNIYKHIKELNPEVKFLLENVRMKQEYQDVITEQLGTKPILINSSLVSAQNRQRLYWTNWEVEQPEDKGVLLKDVLQDDDVIDTKYYTDTAKYKLNFLNNNENTSKTTRIANIGKSGQGQRVYSENCKSVTLSALGGGQGAKTGLYKINKKGHIKTNQDKASCLTGGANSGGNHSDMDLIKRDCSIRRLTPVECERLQTLPDNYTSGVSNTQRYKSLGNGWTIDVIAHILKGMEK